MICDMIYKEINEQFDKIYTLYSFMRWFKLHHEYCLSVQQVL